MTPRILRDLAILRHFHAAMTILWALLSIPTVLWWRDSVMWVALMLLWANTVGHWSAWQATRAEEEAKEGAP